MKNLKIKRRYIVILSFLLCFSSLNLNVFANSPQKVKKVKTLNQYIENSKHKKYTTFKIKKSDGKIGNTSFKDRFKVPYNKSKINQILGEENYTILNETDTEYEVSSNFSTKRLLITKELTDLGDAVSGISYENNTILEYSSEEKTEEAYNNLVEEFGEENVLMDIPLKSSYEGWGTEFMGLDIKKQSTSKNIVVAVIDTGINPSHQIFNNTTISSLSKGAGFDSYIDDEGHGTMTAGIIAESTNSTILAIKALDSEGEGSFINLCQAIQYATSCNADVINMSFGGTLPRSNRVAMDLYLKSAYDKGIIACAASGNESTDMKNSYPADSKYVISVGSINKSKNLSSFSNYGTNLDFVAPGSNIKLPYNNSYAYASGTSFASPYIASSVAVLKNENKNINMDNAITKLKSISEDLGTSGWDKYYGWGLPKFSNSSPVDPDPTDPDPTHNLPNIDTDKTLPNATLEYTTTTYSFTSKKPKVYIEGLTENEDFKVTYSNNLNVGTATVKITGINGYEGEQIKYFTINPLLIDNPTIELSSDSFSYDGTAKIPTVKVKVNNSYVDNFTVSYPSSPINAGNYIISISLGGNLRGVASKSYKINKKKIIPTIALKSNKFEYTGKGINPVDDVTHRGTKLNYTVTYPNGNINMGTRVANIIISEDNYEGTQQINFDIVPTKPKIISASFKNNMIKISCSSVGATGYEFYTSRGGKMFALYPNISSSVEISDNSKYMYKYVNIYSYTIINGVKYYSPIKKTIVIRGI